MPKVLLVEDEPSLSEMYKMALENGPLAGSVFYAFTGEEAFKKAKEEKPDLILLDMLLGETSGIDVLKNIRQEESIKNTPIFALTNFDVDATRDEALKLGVEKYLIKSQLTPLTLATLVKDKLGVK